VKHVLFVCTHNAGRSQIAQAFFERHSPADMRAESAGQQPRDEIEGRIVELVENRLHLIRSNRTAHQLRLRKLLSQLAGEFEGLRSQAEVRACADAILGEYAEVPVRSHVMALAYRKTRDCLRAEPCDAVPA
jgi:predicted protein tyrosine phosphatase